MKRLGADREVNVVDGALVLAAIVQDIAVEAVGIRTSRPVGDGTTAGSQRFVKPPLKKVEVAECGMSLPVGVWH